MGTWVHVVPLSLSLSLSLSFYSLGFESSSHGESGGIEPPSEPNRRRRQGRPRSLNVSSAALLDSGKLVLQNSSDSPLWQSFENPTDTLVQSQNFTSAASLVSGGYSFSLLRSSGNLTLRWNGTVVYFNEGFNASFTANRTLSSPTVFLQSNGILSLADAVLGSSPVVVAYSSNYGESGNMLRFVRLDPDGNLRVYSVSSGSSAPTEEWSAVADQCEVFAFCGNMGVCSYNDTAPVCGCPSQNFLPADPADPRQGCRPRTPLQDCQANWTMLQLDNTRFLTYPPQINNEQFFVGITACRQNCLTGQSCVASTALADGSGFCYIVISDFVSGYHSAALPSTSYVKVCAEGGELFDRIVARGHYTERAAAVVTRTIVEVVQRAHPQEESSFEATFVPIFSIKRIRANLTLRES